MITFTEDQLIALGATVDEQMGGFDDSYADLMANIIIPENDSNPTECILELVGCYLQGLPRDHARDLMYGFIAEKELCEMYDFIDDPTTWKSVIARWRLSLGF